MLSRDVIKICTFNCHGLLSKYKEKTIVQDFDRYHLSLAGLTETHWKGTGTKKLGDHQVFWSGGGKSYAGVSL